MANLIDLDCRDQAGNLRIVIETPRGSLAKLKYHPPLQTFELQRFISSASAGGYPYDWGFVPGTLAADGDPLDALVIHEGHTFPGVIIPAVAISLLKLTETKTGQSERRRNDRLIAVPAAALAHGAPVEVSQATRASLEQFFLAAGELANKRVSVEGWGNAAEATEAVTQAVEAYSAKGGRASA